MENTSWNTDQNRQCLTFQDTGRVWWQGLTMPWLPISHHYCLSFPLLNNRNNKQQFAWERTQNLQRTHSFWQIFFLPSPHLMNQQISFSSIWGAYNNVTRFSCFLVHTKGVLGICHQILFSSNLGIRSGILLKFLLIFSHIFFPLEFLFLELISNEVHILWWLVNIYNGWPGNINSEEVGAFHSSCIRPGDRSSMYE